MTNSPDVTAGQEPVKALMSSPSSVTVMLMDWSNGDQSAVNRLQPLVHKELRRLAASHLRRERANHTLQPTALVHEAYLRLVHQDQVQWQGRAQFFGLCAKLMRQILVDYARRHKAAKYGGGARPVALNEALVYAPERSDELLALDEAMARLAQVDARKSQVVELRFFAGMTAEESAEVLGVSPNTVLRDWDFARAWLRRDLSTTREKARAGGQG